MSTRSAARSAHTATSRLFDGVDADLMARIRNTARQNDKNKDYDRAEAARRRQARQAKTTHQQIKG